MKHTPAPWIVRRKDEETNEILGNEPQFSTAYYGGQIRIAEVLESESDEANTRLIKSAPDLLDIVMRALDVCVFNEETSAEGAKLLTDARNILAEIEGRITHWQARRRKRGQEITEHEILPTVRSIRTKRR